MSTSTAFSFKNHKQQINLNLSSANVNCHQYRWIFQAPNFEYVATWYSSPTQAASLADLHPFICQFANFLARSDGFFIEKRVVLLVLPGSLRLSGSVAVSHQYTSDMNTRPNVDSNNYYLLIWYIQPNFWGPKHQYQRQTETSAEKTTSNLVKWPFINKQNSTWSNSPCSLCDCKCMIHLHIIHIICTPINLIEWKLNALSTIIQNLKPNTQGMRLTYWHVLACDIFRDKIKVQ